MTKPLFPSDDENNEPVKPIIPNLVETTTMRKTRPTIPVVFGYGRLNPPTLGHQKLVNTILAVAKQRGGIPMLYLSKSEGNRDNPLDYKKKLAYVRQLFPQIRVIDDKGATNPFQVVKSLSVSGYTDVTLVAGDDRLTSYQQFLPYVKHVGDKSYNPQKDIQLDRFAIISSGDRDAKSRGVAGVSASKMRELAVKGQYKSFARGLPKNCNPRMAQDIYNNVRAPSGRRFYLKP